VRELRNVARRVSLLDPGEAVGAALLSGLLSGPEADGAPREGVEADLVRLITGRGPLAAGEISARAGVPLRTVQRHLRRLVDAGDVAALGRGRARVYGTT
jgi:DNA-binding transcriptional ArsR family regulator